MRRINTSTAIGLIAFALGIFAAPARAELQPGDTLGKANCQEAKELLPERVLTGFCNGEFGPSEIVEVLDS